METEFYLATVAEMSAARTALKKSGFEGFHRKLQAETFELRAALDPDDDFLFLVAKHGPVDLNQDERDSFGARHSGYPGLYIYRLPDFLVQELPNANPPASKGSSRS